MKLKPEHNTMLIGLLGTILLGIFSWALMTIVQLEGSEEHTSELQSRLHLVCRLLLEKKKKNSN